MNDDDKRCYLSAFLGDHGAERNPAGYQRRDDGNHIYQDDEYYEWWYVDASFDNGYHMVMSFQYRNGHLQPIIPTMSISVYKPGGGMLFKQTACKPEETYAGADWCDLRMKDCRLKDRGDGSYEMYAMIQNVGAHIVMRNTVPGWKCGTGLTYKDERTGHVAGWVVPVPNAEAEGQLYLNGQTVPVKGYAYHDHNWGNFLLYRRYAGWCWGRIHDGVYTIDYAWTVPKVTGAPIFSPLMIACKDNVVLSTDKLEMAVDESAQDETFHQQYARKLTFTADALGVRMKLAIVTEQLLHSFRLPKITEWDEYYFRFLCDYLIDLEIDGKRDQIKGKHLHEYMIL